MPHPLTRRALLQGIMAGGLSAVAPRFSEAAVLRKRIPSTGEDLPAIGLGSWITFNVGEDEELRGECAAVMAAFFEAGGTLIDSSPMYGSSQDVIGYGLDKIGRSGSVFSADKVWTGSAEEGPKQIAASTRFWRIPRFDLLQVHNLVAWAEHLPLLFDMKARGEIRYVGITTSEGRRHDEFERVMRQHPLDFIQITYNILDREVEQRLLPLARDLNVAVIANRPFQQGALIERLERHPLPAWAAEIGAATWAQFILKFIISHPDVTCAIPATTRVDHVRENVATAAGPLLDQETRARMAAYVGKL
jgi:diketogulonate reductase-like aldo/keto reductase